MIVAEVSIKNIEKDGGTVSATGNLMILEDFVLRADGVVDIFADEKTPVADLDMIAARRFHQILVKAVKDLESKYALSENAPVDRLEPTEGYKMTNIPLAGELSDETVERKKRA